MARYSGGRGIRGNVLGVLTKTGERILAQYSGRHGIRGTCIGGFTKTGKEWWHGIRGDTVLYSGAQYWGFNKSGGKNVGTVFGETRYSGAQYSGFKKNGEKNGGTVFGGHSFRWGVLGVLQKRGKEWWHSVRGDTVFGRPLLGVLQKRGKEWWHGIRGDTVFGGPARYWGFYSILLFIKRTITPCLSGAANLCNLFRLSEDGRVLFMSGMWDNSLRVGQVNQHEISPLTVLYQHKNVVTCMELDGKYLATGGRDTTVVVWKTLRRQGECVGMKPHPSAILYGHNSAVTCVALSQELDLVVSGSSEGSVLIHTLKLGTYIRTVVPHVPGPENEHLCVKFVGIAGNGNIVITGKIPSKNAAGGFHSVIYLYTINGKMIKRAKFEDEVGAMFLDGERVVLGGLEGSLEIRDTNYINLKHKLRLKSGVLAISKDPRNQHLFVTTSDGKLLILTPTAKAFVKK